MHVVLANMASYTFGREAFVAAEAEAEVHLCFVAEAECGPKPHFERHSAPEPKPKPNFGRSLIQAFHPRRRRQWYIHG